MDHIKYLYSTRKVFYICPTVLYLVYFYVSLIEIDGVVALYSPNIRNPLPKKQKPVPVILNLNLQKADQRKNKKLLL